MTDWQGIHMDWAGPWPLAGGHANLRNHTQRLAVDLFFDFHGDVVEAGHFFLAVRRFFAQDGPAVLGMPLDEEFPPSATRVGTDWANGEIVNADPGTTLIVRDGEADQLAFALHTLAGTAHHHDLFNHGVLKGGGVWPLDQATVQTWTGDVQLELIGMSGDNGLHLHADMVDAVEYADGTPLPFGYAMWIRLRWSDHTWNHPWEMSLTEAMSFGTALQMILSQRRAYLDAAGEQGLCIAVEYPDGSADRGVSGEPADWDRLEQQAATLAEDTLMAGACHVVVSVAGYPLADLNVDGLVDEDQEVWYNTYGRA